MGKKEEATNLKSEILKITCDNCRFDCEGGVCDTTMRVENAFKNTLVELDEKSVFTLGFYTVDIREIIERLR